MIACFELVGKLSACEIVGEFDIEIVQVFEGIILAWMRLQRLWFVETWLSPGAVIDAENRSPFCGIRLGSLT